MFKIPLYQPSLDGNEKTYVNDCLESNWISSKGKYITEFEKKFAEYIGARYAGAVANGTVALHLSLVAMGVGQGDEVIVPTLTFVACANAVVYTGASPVFVDSLENTWQMDPDEVRRKITTKTRAIIAVHLYGHPCEIDELAAIAKEHDLYLLEDCAEALGARYKNRLVGGFGDMSIFSFYGNKTITTGEGGMVVTNNETLYDRAVRFRGQGLAKNRQYWHEILGYNYRMTNISAAIGLAQLERLEHFISKKRRIAEWYREELKESPVQFHDATGQVMHSYWMCSILVPEPRQRDELRDYLAGKGIETRPMFYPIHTLPCYAPKFGRHKVAENLGWRGINLPSWPGLDKKQVDFICQSIFDFFKERKEGERDGQ